MEQDFKLLARYLNSEKDLYIEILELSKKKQQAIVDNHVNELNFIVESEKDIAGKIISIERDRMACAADIAYKLGLNDNATLMGIISVSNDDTSELADLLQELKAIVERVKKHNTINNDLVRIQLDYIDSFKSAFFDGQGNYGVDGKDVTDKKQSINLFDRMV